jgi:hypothetical protein
MVLRRGQPFAQVVVPEHKELDRGTLRAILRGAGIAVEEFSGLLGRLPVTAFVISEPSQAPTTALRRRAER